MNVKRSSSKKPRPRIADLSRLVNPFIDSNDESVYLCEIDYSRLVEYPERESLDPTIETITRGQRYICPECHAVYDTAIDLMPKDPKSGIGRPIDYSGNNSSNKNIYFKSVNFQNSGFTRKSPTKDIDSAVLEENEKERWRERGVTVVSEKIYLP